MMAHSHEPPTRTCSMCCNLSLSFLHAALPPLHCRIIPSPVTAVNAIHIPSNTTTRPCVIGENLLFFPNHHSCKSKLRQLTIFSLSVPQPPSSTHRSFNTSPI